MQQPCTSELTELLVMWSNGDEAALNRLIPQVERELHRIAHYHMVREDGTHTLQATALVNEAYLKLINQNVRWQNRAHFFGVASQIMRRVLLDHARAQLRVKRGGGAQHVPLVEVLLPVPDASNVQELSVLFETNTAFPSQNYLFLQRTPSRSNLNARYDSLLARSSMSVESL